MSRSVTACRSPCSLLRARHVCNCRKNSVSRDRASALRSQKDSLCPHTNQPPARRPSTWAAYFVCHIVTPFLPMIDGNRFGGFTEPISIWNLCRFHPTLRRLEKLRYVGCVALWAFTRSHVHTSSPSLWTLSLAEMLEHM
jgi:hypothetical protein